MTHDSRQSARDPESAATAARPKHWAQPVQLSAVRNLHRVSDMLYRCAQPTPNGLRQLERLGIRTVLSLRAFHAQHRVSSSDTGLRFRRLPMKSWFPRQKDAMRFLSLATSAADTPLLVHCQHGADRTGAMCAVYRVIVQGWSKAEAIREMTGGGYGFHRVWRNLPYWIRRLKVDALRAELGIELPETPAPPGHGAPGAADCTGPVREGDEGIDSRTAS